MLARLSVRLADVARAVVPDPFLIALGLSLVAFALGYATMDDPDVGALASGWFARVRAPGTLAFTFQMTWILVAGTALAQAPIVRRALGRLADIPRTTGGAAALTSAVAMAAGLLNWGFGLVAGALLARRIGERARDDGRPLNYPLVAAAGYTCMMVWHGGLSGSAPLKVTEGAPNDGPPIPLDETVLSPMNLALTAGFLVVIPWVFTRLAKGGEEREVVLPPRAGDEDLRDEVTTVQRVLGLFVVALGLVALVGRALDVGPLRAVTLDTMNLALVVVGLLLYGSPLRFGRAFGRAVPEASGILLQFPFYFGILGLMESAGLVARLAEGSVALSASLATLGLPEAFCFDVVTFLSAGLVNLFVPSGGGQWAVQGTIVTQAAGEIGVPLPRAVMALSYGDEWTNMLQPFWALALLSITGLEARDILGYTLTIMLAALPLYFLAFLVY